MIYIVEEEFEDDDLDDWILNLSVWSYPNLTSFAPTEFVVHDGFIEAQGTFSNFETFEAIHETSMSTGIWHIDVNYPMHRVVTEFDWYIYLSDNYYGGIEDDKSNYLYSTVTRNGTFMEISQGRINLYQYQTGNRGFPHEILISQTIPSDTWINYDFIKTPKSFLILINQNIVANITYSDQVAEYGHFSLLTNLGSGLKFDNIRISEDFEAYLSDLSDPSSFLAPESSNSKMLVSKYHLILSIGIMISFRTKRRFT